MTAIDRAAIIEQAAKVLHEHGGCDCGQISPCDGVDYGYDFTEDAVAVLPVIAKALLAPLREQAKEWQREGAEAEAYFNRAHYTEIHEVMTEARIYPEVADMVIAICQAIETEVSA